MGKRLPNPKYRGIFNDKILFTAKSVVASRTCINIIWNLTWIPKKTKIMPKVMIKIFLNLSGGINIVYNCDDTDKHIQIVLTKT